MHVAMLDMVLALSDALDLVGVDNFMHGKRVGVMAAECAGLLGLGEAARARLLRAGLVHDCGVSSTALHRKLVAELDWDGAYEHCERGHALLRDFGPLSDLAPVILYHHTHWTALPDILEEDLRRDANLIFLVDRVDALTAPYYDHPEFLFLKDQTQAAIRRQAGEMFSPELVDAFMEAARAESFWLNLEPRSIWPYLRHAAVDLAAVELDFPKLRQLALIFSRIVDAKSPFTVEHSRNTARLSRFLAQAAGLDGRTIEKIEIAALLHDIGKLRVPDEVLNKPQGLDAAERAAIMRHSFETYQILHLISGLEDIATWAAYHHEKLNGTGYPFHRRSDGITLPARIVGVADVFQALTQNRPYRSPLDRTAVLAHLREQVRVGCLDAEVVALVERHIDECWHLATGGGAAD
jgi:HD-GYP domain-containing protein (c-di-GMP phosphodiesterase class II)